MREDKRIRILWLAPGVDHTKPTSGGLLYSAHFLRALHTRFGDNAVRELNWAYEKKGWLLNRVITNFRYLIYCLTGGLRGADLIVVNSDSNSHLLAPILAIRAWFRIPILMTVYHTGASAGTGGRDALRATAESLFILCATSIVTISDSTCSAVIDIYSRFGLRRGRIDLILPGVNKNQNPPRLPSMASPCRLLYVGSCEDPRKGLDVLLKAMSDLPAGAFTLHLAGTFRTTNAYAMKLSTMLKEYGLNRNVTFLGRVSDEKLRNLFSTSDVFVFPSRWEGYGIVLAEAMGYGLPIVSTQAGAIPEIVKDGVNGILVPAGDPARLRDAIAELGSNSRRRIEIARRNYESSLAFPTWSDTREALIKVMRHEVDLPYSVV